MSQPVPCLLLGTPSIWKTTSPGIPSDFSPWAASSAVCPPTCGCFSGSCLVPLSTLLPDWPHPLPLSLKTPKSSPTDPISSQPSRAHSTRITCPREGPTTHPAGESPDLVSFLTPHLPFKSCGSYHLKKSPPTFLTGLLFEFRPCHLWSGLLSCPPLIPEAWAPCLCRTWCYTALTFFLPVSLIASGAP